ncbi:MAG TPA: hypothetical protein VJJ83_04790 [Candidatus Babeliales bacterium]|nr:hypothetical protein [Candidatus Babeliales bacterium]
MLTKNLRRKQLRILTLLAITSQTNASYAGLGQLSQWCQRAWQTVTTTIQHQRRLADAQALLKLYQTHQLKHSQAIRQLLGTKKTHATGSIALLQVDADVAYHARKVAEFSLANIKQQHKVMLLKTAPERRTAAADEILRAVR